MPTNLCKSIVKKDNGLLSWVFYSLSIHLCITLVYLMRSNTFFVLLLFFPSKSDVGLKERHSRLNDVPTCFRWMFVFSPYKHFLSDTWSSKMVTTMLNIYMRMCRYTWVNTGKFVRYKTKKIYLFFRVWFSLSMFRFKIKKKS